MPILANLSLIRVHGRYVKLDGTPAQGTVTFTPNTILVDPVSREIVKPVGFTAQLDAQGRIIGQDNDPGVLLPATDDPDLDPQGWSYQVAENIAGVLATRRYSLELPYDLAGGTFDLSTVSPSAPPSSGTSNYVTIPALEARLAELDGADPEVIQQAVVDYLTANPPAGSGDVTSAQLAAAVDGHDGDVDAHPALRSRLTALEEAPGGGGSDGREVELRATASDVEWRYVGDPSWTTLVPLSVLAGADGEDGSDGEDGREVELSTSDTHIRWRYVGDSTWTDLVALSDLRGADGEPGDSHVPDPTSEPDNRWLRTAGGELVYGPAPEGGGLTSTTIGSFETGDTLPAVPPADGKTHLFILKAPA